MFDEAYEILLEGLTSKSLSHEGRFHSIKDGDGGAASAAAAPAVVVRRRFGGARQVGGGDRINIMALRPATAVRPFTDAFCDAWEETGRPVAERPLRGVDRPLVLAEDGAEARRVATEAHAVYYHSLMLLWVHAGITPPTHFPPTFQLWQEHGGAFAGTPEERASSSPGRSRWQGWTR